MKNKNLNNDVLVSICCITYNQEKYIRDTIEGFLAQKTNFNFEIIIHDDASIDKTADILKEYKKRYPKLIKTIIQTENQYSKGKSIVDDLFLMAKGKFIAICEGDDYWIDSNKLQCQIDYMLTHKDCSFCFHNAYIYNEIKKDFKIFLPTSSRTKKILKSKKNSNFNAGEILNIGFIPTASFIFRKSDVEEINNFLVNYSIGDIPIKLIASKQGYAHYIDKIMSVYRINTGISLVDKMNKSNIEKKSSSLKELLNLYENFNSVTKYEYNDYVEKEKALTYLYLFNLCNSQNSFFEPEYIKYYKKLNLKIKIKIFIKAKFKNMYKFFKFIKNKLNTKN